MNKNFSFLLLAALLTLAVFSCRKSDETSSYNPDYTKGYYPLEFGHYVVYDVDSILWDDFLCVRTVHKYQMRYTVADTFRDDENRQSYRLDVHIRTADSLPWRTHRVIYATPTPERLEFVEANLRFIKLVFPISLDRRWLGNGYVSPHDEEFQYFQDWEYRFTRLGENYSNGKVDFENTVTVEQVDRQVNDPELQPGNYSEKTFGKEIYGFGIGLLYREMTRWTYDPNISGCRRGYSVVMRAVDHN